MRRFLVPLLLLGITALAFGFGARETPPNIGIGGEDTVYISPTVSIGVQDTVTIPITVTTEGGNTNVIVGAGPTFPRTKEPTGQLFLTETTPTFSP